MPKAWDLKVFILGSRIASKRLVIPDRDRTQTFLLVVVVVPRPLSILIDARPFNAVWGAFE